MTKMECPEWVCAWCVSYHNCSILHERRLQAWKGRWLALDPITRKGKPRPVLFVSTITCLEFEHQTSTFLKGDSSMLLPVSNYKYV
jgi:hypothetical protein